MTKANRIFKVAILMNAELDWGRDIISGILNYAQEIEPWDIWIRRDSPRVFEHLPKGWDGDGVIGRFSSESLVKELKKSKIPFVNVDDSPVENLKAPSFFTDDEAGTRMAAEFFVDKGFRTIALAGSKQSMMPRGYGAAFEKALADYDLTCNFYEMAGVANTDLKELGAWLKNLPKPVGLLSCGVSGAAKIVTLCNELGISVPHDVSVLASRDDKIACHSCFPPLSGIIAPTEQIGYQAASRLHKMMKGIEVDVKPTFIPPPGIVERLSTDTLAVEDPRLIKAMQFIKEHAFESITMNDILKVVPMSRRSLERRFSEVFKRTPNDEVRRLRMNKAKELLAETDLPMADIAEACGYSSYNYLSHAFRNATGKSPSAYRKQFQ